MKILQISSASTFGGGERYVVDLANALQSRGHDLYVIVRPNSPLPTYLEIPKDQIKELPLRNALDAPSARELDKFVESHLSSMARDLDDAPVFMAANAFNLQYEMDRYKAIEFSDVKDYQKKAA